MAEDRECRGCGVRVRLSDEQVRAILEAYLRDHPGPLADDAEYGRRLALCRACAALEYGTTCRHCGCLVQVRARLAAGACPRPQGPAW